MSSNPSADIVVGLLRVAADDNAQAMDFLVRVHKEAEQYAEAAGDPHAVDGYVVTHVLQALALAEDTRIEGESARATT